MRQAPLLMDVTAEFTGECTDVLTAAPTTRVLPPITTVLPRTITALGLTTVLLRIMVLLRIITALPPITAVPAFTLVSGSRPEARQPRNNAGGRSARRRAALCVPTRRRRARAGATLRRGRVRECRRGNRIAVLFAALHMSAHGTKRTNRDAC